MREGATSSTTDCTDDMRETDGSDTDGSVDVETAAVEALSARYRRIFEHRRLMLVVPPPLNAPYVVLGLVRHYVCCHW